MDSTTKDFLRRYKAIDPPRPHTSLTLYKEKWSIAVDGVNLTEIEYEKLYTKLYGQQTPVC